MSLLAPYIALAWLSSRWFTRGQMPANEIVEGVWLGRFPTPGELTARVWLQWWMSRLNCPSRDGASSIEVFRCWT